MKWLAVILAVVGALGVLTSIQLALTKYDLGNEHDFSKWVGGMGVSMLVGLGGLSMWLRRSRKGDGLVACPHCGRRNGAGTQICPRCERRLPAAE